MRQPLRQFSVFVRSTRKCMAPMSSKQDAASLHQSVATGCKACSSQRQARIPSEFNVHYPGLSHLDRLPVLLFPELLVCLDCGFTEFAIPRDVLDRLTQLL